MVLEIIKVAEEKIIIFHTFEFFDTDPKPFSGLENMVGTLAKVVIALNIAVYSEMIFSNYWQWMQISDESNMNCN